MAKELEDIIKDIATELDNADPKGLKQLNMAIEAAAEGDAKKTAQTAYDNKYASIVKKINEAVNQEIENEKLAGFSEEVKARRKNRTIEKVEVEVKAVQGDIDLLTLDISDIDKEIEEKRKSQAPAKVA